MDEHRLSLATPRRQHRETLKAWCIKHLWDDGLLWVMIPAVFVVLAVHSFWTERIIYDPTPPIGYLKQTALTKTVPVGGVFKYRAEFDKRGGCKVTSGGYNVLGKTDDGKAISVLNFNPVSYGTWPVGMGQSVEVGIGIPKIIPPGDYTIWWKYCWRCEGARSVICIPDTPSITSMPLTVVEKSKSLTAASASGL